MSNDPHTKRLLWFIFAGSKGGLNRLKIILCIKKNPANINQLSKELELDYKSILHHIKVLEKNNLITKLGKKYGVAYFISPYLEHHIETLNEIERQLDKSK